MKSGPGARPAFAASGSSGDKGSTVVTNPMAAATAQKQWMAGGKKGRRVSTRHAPKAVSRKPAGSGAPMASIYKQQFERNGGSARLRTGAIGGKGGETDRLRQLCAMLGQELYGPYLRPPLDGGVSPAPRRKLRVTNSMIHGTKALPKKPRKFSAGTHENQREAYREWKKRGSHRGKKSGSHFMQVPDAVHYQILKEYARGCKGWLYFHGLRGLAFDIMLVLSLIHSMFILVIHIPDLIVPGYILAYLQVTPLAQAMVYIITSFEIITLVWRIRSITCGWRGKLRRKIEGLLHDYNDTAKPREGAVFKYVDVMDLHVPTNLRGNTVKIGKVRCVKYSCFKATRRLALKGYRVYERLGGKADDLTDQDSKFYVHFKLLGNFASLVVYMFELHVMGTQSYNGTMVILTGLLMCTCFVVINMLLTSHENKLRVGMVMGIKGILTMWFTWAPVFVLLQSFVGEGANLDIMLDARALFFGGLATEVASKILSRFVATYFLQSAIFEIQDHRVAHKYHMALRRYKKKHFMAAHRGSEKNLYYFGDADDDDFASDEEESKESAHRGAKKRNPKHVVTPSQSDGDHDVELGSRRTRFQHDQHSEYWNDHKNPAKRAAHKTWQEIGPPLNFKCGVISALPGLVLLVWVITVVVVIDLHLCPSTVMVPPATYDRQLAVDGCVRSAYPILRPDLASIMTEGRQCLCSTYLADHRAQATDGRSNALGEKPLLFSKRFEPQSMTSIKVQNTNINGTLADTVVSRYPNLIMLWLDYNNISSFAPIVGESESRSHLMYVSVAHNRLRNFDLDFAKFPDVIDIKLDGNRLQYPPACLKDAGHLNELQIDDNELTSLGLLTSLTSLFTLTVADNKLTSIVGLEKLTRLVVLDVHGNDLKDDAIFEAVPYPKTLEEIRISRTNISTLEHFDAHLPNLKFVDAGHTNINVSAGTTLDSVFPGPSREVLLDGTPWCSSTSKQTSTTRKGINACRPCCCKPKDCEEDFYSRADTMCACRRDDGSPPTCIPYSPLAEGKCREL